MVFDFFPSTAPSVHALLGLIMDTDRVQVPTTVHHKANHTTQATAYNALGTSQEDK